MYKIYKSFWEKKKDDYERMIEPKNAEGDAGGGGELVYGDMPPKGKEGSGGGLDWLSPPKITPRERV